MGGGKLEGAITPSHRWVRQFAFQPGPTRAIWAVGLGRVGTSLTVRVRELLLDWNW